MEHIVCESENNKLFIKLSNEHYDKESVFRAAYNLTNKCTILVQRINEHETGIYFEPKVVSSVDSLKEMAREFVNDVLDQQMRRDLERQFGKLRELIVEHAFSPITDLKDRVNKLK